MGINLAPKPPGSFGLRETVGTGFKSDPYKIDKRARRLAPPRAKRLIAFTLYCPLFNCSNSRSPLVACIIVAKSLIAPSFNTGTGSVFTSGLPGFPVTLN